MDLNTEAETTNIAKLRAVKMKTRGQKQDSNRPSFAASDHCKSNELMQFRDIQMEMKWMREIDNKMDFTLSYPTLLAQERLYQILGDKRA